MIKLKIKNAIDSLSYKFQILNLDTSNISDYNKAYIKKYINDFDYYMSIYTQLLQKALNKIKKPITQSTFIDYGGGCGILSYLAKEMGFKTVIYNDIYQISVKDTQIISKKLNINIDYFIGGDIDVLVNKIKKKRLKPDLICSFDVLEHIYNVKDWFKSVNKIENKFSILFMTHANPKNPLINYRLKKLHRKAEFKGLEKVEGWKKIDIYTSYFEARKNIIKNFAPNISQKNLQMLACETRGLKKFDIEKLVINYLKTSYISYQIKHPTNTCDPFTGNWAEHLINLKELRLTALNNNLKITITNSFYVYSKSKILNIPKSLLNLLLKIFGTKNLLLSPTYTIEVSKKELDK